MGKLAASPAPAPANLDECLARLGINTADPAAFPFVPGDTTGGVENELQVALGYASPRLGRRLERYLADNPEQVWENSWVHQRQLNEGISDAFYPELFMSPCRHAARGKRQRNPLLPA